MITIKLHDGKNKAFQDYHEVCSYIREREKPQTLDTGEITWRFMRRRTDTLSSLYYRTPSLKDFLTQKEIEAVEKQLGLMEIVAGEWENLTQILITPELDIEPLKRKWCHEYCKEHELKIFEWVLKK